MEFSKEHIDIRENETSSSSPLYLLCDNVYHRAKISIAIPFRGMDVRMTIRTGMTVWLPLYSDYSPELAPPFSITI